MIFISKWKVFDIQFHFILLQINFKCGLEDKIISIHEFEVCEYLVEFVTPAAC